MRGVVLLACVLLCLLPLACGQALSTASANCSVTPAKLAQDHGSLPRYLTQSPKELRSEVPSLNSLKFDSKAADDAALPILEHVGEVINAMVPRVPNLIAEESLTQVRVALPYNASDVSSGSSGPKTGGRMNSMSSFTTSAHEVSPEELLKILHTQLAGSSQHAIFSYRVRAANDPVHGETLEEYRVDAANHAVVLPDLSPGHPAGTGFSTMWLLFRPENLAQSHFRYLGTQKIDGHQAFVIAFAQNPQSSALASEISMGDRSCTFYVQGILWIDQETYRIVRLENDLQSPVSALSLDHLRSAVRFSEVRIEQRNLSLWLPSDVEITWSTDKQAGGELHRYSKYRLFGATSTIIPK